MTEKRIPKTKKVIVLQGRYGGGHGGWDDIAEYNSPVEARDDLSAYRYNVPNVEHRLIRRRIPNPDYVAAKTTE